MPTKKIVLDTNGLISSLSRRGNYYPIWKSFQEGKYILCISNEIIEEYAEIIGRLIFLKDIKFPELIVLKLREFLDEVKRL